MSFVIYGVHPVEELLEAAPEKVRELLLKDPSSAQFDTIVSLADHHGVDRREVGTEEIERISEGGNHQGVAAVVREFEYGTLDSLLAETEDLSTAAVLVLDSVTDPHNLGALLRTAAALGASAVIIPKNRAASVTPAVVRASAGLALAIPVIQVTNVSRTLESLAEDGWWSVAAVMDGQPAPEIDMVMKAAIVLGSEGDGIRRLVEETCDFRASIPMAPGVESLNVSVAGALLLYEWARQCR